METDPMKMHGTNPQRMHAMPAGRAARSAAGIGAAATYRWHSIPCTAVVEVFVDTTKLPARRLSEVPL
jgi:hypothetical protein